MQTDVSAYGVAELTPHQASATFGGWLPALAWVFGIAGGVGILGITAAYIASVILKQKHG